MNRLALALALALASLTIGASFVAEAQQHTSNFRVSLTIVGPEGIPPVVGMPMPEDSQIIARRETTTYRIHDRNLKNSKQFFLEAFPSSGFTLEAEQEGSDWWEGIWKQTTQGSCVQIVAHSVVGIEKTRIQATPVVC
jgi:hypothetical protein